jgi:uncharacterized protein
MANPVTWFEIIGTDAPTLHRFYREVFGWKMTPPVKEMGNYSMLQDHEPGIAGGVGAGPEARVSVYIESTDPQTLLDKATARGARMIMPVTTITPDTTIAMFTDPAGNTVGLLKANPRPQARRAASSSRPAAARAKATARKSGTKTRRTGRAARGTRRR